MIRLLLLLLGWGCSLGALAAPGGLPLVLLQDASDPRYRSEELAKQSALLPWGRLQPAVELALHESRFALQALQLQPQLRVIEANGSAALSEQARQLAGQGVQWFLIDAPAASVGAVAAALAGQPVALINVSALDDSLRGADCQANLLHTIPNRAMLADAIAQQLVARQWNKLLLLQGPETADAEWGVAFDRAIKRYRLKLLDRRSFVLGSDPRQRELNDPLLLTRGGDYDVIVVLDSDGEFARGLPYRSQLPRPVVGAEGLVAQAWHWSWERYGAPQLESRFEAKTARRMTSYDWAAWVAVKAVVEALQRGGKDFSTAYAHLRSDDMVLDGFKGARMGFRRWDGQLRQPIFLSTANAVVAVTPLDAYLHPVNVLDTLGFDAQETACRKGAGA